MIILGLGLVSLVVISIIIGSAFRLDYKLFNYATGEKEFDYTTVAKLKWKNVVQFYRVNPDRWDYRNLTEFKIYGIPTHTDFKVLLFNTQDKWNAEGTVRVQLSFLGYICFRFAKKFKQPDDSYGVKLIINTVQQDVDLLREEINDFVISNTNSIPINENEKERK